MGIYPHEDESWQDDLLDVWASKTYSLPAPSQTTAHCVILYAHYSLLNSQRAHTHTQGMATSWISNSVCKNLFIISLTRSNIRRTSVRMININASAFQNFTVSVKGQSTKQSCSLQQQCSCLNLHPRNKSVLLHSWAFQEKSQQNSMFMFKWTASPCQRVWVWFCPL